METDNVGRYPPNSLKTLLTSSVARDNTTITDNQHDRGTAVEPMRCPVFVDGKECGRELTEVNLDAKLIVSHLVVCECSLGQCGQSNPSH
jgi:hypothetical protein